MIDLYNQLAEAEAKLGNATDALKFRHYVSAWETAHTKFRRQMEAETVPVGSDGSGSASGKPYDPLDSLESEVERFMRTNLFTPMEVTGFYIQARCVISELKAARKENDYLRNVRERQAAMLRKLNSDIIELEEQVIALQQNTGDDPRAGIDGLATGCARSFVRMFKPRFAALVEAGTKLQTVRPTPKRMPRPGDTISLRCWRGAPYRSKQRVLREAQITTVHEIIISEGGIIIGTDRMTWAPHLDGFARLDGFADWEEMREWFRNTHGLPFHGVVLSWQNVRNEPRDE